MASFVFNIAKQEIGQADIDLETATLKAKLCMDAVVEATDKDVDTVTGLSTLDESDDSTYAEVTLAGKSVAVDDTNDWALFSANNIVFSGLTGDATSVYNGILIYYDDGGNGVPIAWVQFSSTITNAATQVTVPNTNGYFRLA